MTRTSHFRPVRRRMAVLACAAASLVTGVPTAASAQTPPPTTPQSLEARLAALRNGELQQFGLPSMAEMELAMARYQGPTTAFSQFYALRANQPLGSWLAANGTAFSSALEAPTLGATMLGGSTQLSSPEALQDFLAKSGFATTSRSWATYAQEVMRDPIGAPIVRNSMDFATQVAAMRAPDIAALSAGLATAGLFSERAITALATDHPDIITQVQAGGRLSPASVSAWRSTMTKAAKAALPQAADGLIDPCQASLLWAMGSGSATGARAIGGSNCGACVAQGLYMHSNFSNMLNQTVSTSVIPPADFNQIPSWRRSAIVSQNPQVTATPSFTTGAKGCTGTTAGASRVISGALKSLFAPPTP